jgi:hypothetical protein
MKFSDTAIEAFGSGIGAGTGWILCVIVFNWIFPAIIPAFVAVLVRLANTGCV